MELSEFITLPKVDGVTLLNPFGDSFIGSLFVTSHRLLFCSRDDERGPKELWMDYKKIDLVTRSQDHSGRLTLYCKDFTVIHLIISDSSECKQVASSIHKLSNLGTVSLTYPFFYKMDFESVENGWLAFTPEAEFTARFKNVSHECRLANVNKDFKLCPTYPEAVIVPKIIDDDTIKKAAKFRQGGRFPVPCYKHGRTGTFLLRSGQPLTGPQFRRSRDDEELLSAYVVPGKRAYIVDTRKASLAKSEQQKGGGCEVEGHYHQWKRHHSPMERWYNLQESLRQLVDACAEPSLTTDQYLSKLNSSHWLDNVRDALLCALVIAQSMEKENASVLVHGTDGTDTTLQATSLAQLLLDPDCRTVRGFEALVEREWLQAGHPFSSRCAKLAYATTEYKEEAPVFLLFLDCAWQVWQQYPSSFEFNEEFLIMLFEHAYCSKFGTFLCNNVQERLRFELATKTVSLWSYVNTPGVLQAYLNPIYEPNANVLWPSIFPQSLALWTTMYVRNALDHVPMKLVWQELASVKEQNKELLVRARRLRRQVEALSKEAVEMGVESVDLFAQSENGGET